MSKTTLREEYINSFPEELRLDAAKISQRISRDDNSPFFAQHLAMVNCVGLQVEEFRISQTKSIKEWAANIEKIVKANEGSNKETQHAIRSLTHQLGKGWGFKLTMSRIATTLSCMAFGALLAAGGTWYLHQELFKLVSMEKKITSSSNSAFVANSLEVAKAANTHIASLFAYTSLLSIPNIKTAYDPNRGTIFSIPSDEVNVITTNGQTQLIINPQTHLKLKGVLDSLQGTGVIELIKEGNKVESKVESKNSEENNSSTK
jgi:hypothetical protein